MKRARPRILSASAEPLLFETRNRVLESAGFDVVRCMRGIGAREWFRGERFDAVVLGGFDDLGIRRSLIDEFKRQRLNVPILVVYHLDDPWETYAGADQTMESLDGPKQLISLVGQMIKFLPASATPRDAAAAHAGD